MQVNKMTGREEKNHCNKKRDDRIALLVKVDLPGVNKD